MNSPSTLAANLERTVRSGRLVETPLPLCPEISLHLISSDYPRGRLDYDEMIAIINAPAYWAFCWASGQVLARHILMNRHHYTGKTVLDFGAGSGVVAIAAAMAGAARVIACDNDADALAACIANARLNNVTLDTLDDIETLSERPDCIIAADVLYDRDNLQWLDQLPRLADKIIVADSRVKDVEIHGYRLVDTREATTIPDLDELEEFNQVKIYLRD